MASNHFNIRVYGLLIDEGSVLVTDEFRLGTHMTKFPGGGLHFGEGTLDCLKREFLEELQCEIEITGHFYTTGFYQPAALLPSDMQLISIYYMVKTAKPYRFATTSAVNDIPPVDGAQSFRWVPVRSLAVDDFTFPVDRHVAALLKEQEKEDYNRISIP